MKKLFVAALSALALMACKNTTPAKTTQLLTAEDSLSYALGINIGESLQKQGIENLNTDIISNAIHQAFGDDSTVLMDNDAAVAFLNTYFQKKQMAMMEKKLQEGKDFLAENAKQPGIQVTTSGLQYQVVKEGTGATPASGDSVTVNYRGALTDGTVFESTYETNSPVTFSIEEVIPGWTEGLKLMKEGASYKFFIPSELGFGAMGGGPVPANSVLIFDVDLIKVRKK